MRLEQKDLFKYEDYGNYITVEFFENVIKPALDKYKK